MEQKLLTDLKVGDTIYRIVEKRKHTHKDIKIDELEVTCADNKNNYLTIKSGDETLID